MDIIFCLESQPNFQLLNNAINIISGTEGALNFIGVYTSHDTHTHKGR